MAKKGEKLVNPATGEYFEFVETSAETGGKYTKIKVLLKAGGFKPVLHLHLQQDEHFEVISGKLSYVLDGKTGTLGPGESITLPKAVGHTHYNAEDEDLLVYQTSSPSLDIEPFLESLHYNNVQGRMPKGEPPFLQIMVWMRELQGKTCLASVPLGLQKFLALLLAPLGKALGYKSFYT